MKSRLKLSQKKKMFRKSQILLYYNHFTIAEKCHDRLLKWNF